MSILDKISADLLLNRASILAIVEDTSRHYRRFETRTGRVVWQPSPQLKILQYWVVDFLRSHGSAPNHCATAYELGCNILKNAQVHEDNDHLLRMDVRHFFPSVRRSLIIPYLEGVDCVPRLTDCDIELILRIVLLNGGLTIGAPSSPVIANRAMIPFDKRATSMAQLNKPTILYTRYSDDLFFSSAERIDESFAMDVAVLLREYGLMPNAGKTRFLGPGSNRMMVGIAINHRRTASLGQKRKAQLRSKLYSFMMQDTPSREEAQHLSGFIMFAKSIEPAYVNKMLIKYSAYGGDVMLKISKVLKCNICQ